MYSSNFFFILRLSRLHILTFIEVTCLLITIHQVNGLGEKNYRLVYFRDDYKTFRLSCSRLLLEMMQWTLCV